jgi:hypothetical protein
MITQKMEGAPLQESPSQDFKIVKLVCHNPSLSQPFAPRTPHDFNRLTTWTSLGFSSEKISRLMCDRFWRSELTLQNGVHRCLDCDQIPSFITCIGCGMPFMEVQK